MRHKARLAVAVSIALLAPRTMPAQDLPESSPQALMHHAQGVDAYVRGRNADAINHFTLAFKSDPTSYVSLLMAGVAAGNAGQGARADSFYAIVAPHKDKLSPYYRYRLEAQMAGRAGNPVASSRRCDSTVPVSRVRQEVAGIEEDALLRGANDQSRASLEPPLARDVTGDGDAERPALTP